MNGFIYNTMYSFYSSGMLNIAYSTVTGAKAKVLNCTFYLYFTAKCLVLIKSMTSSSSILIEIISLVHGFQINYKYVWEHESGIVIPTFLQI